MAFLNIPEYLPDIPDWCRRMAKRINEISLGKTNNIIEITLTANVGTSTITLPPFLLGQDTQVLFAPTTANAAAELGAGIIYVSSRDVRNNQMTITHQNNAQTDRTFKAIFIG